MPKDMTDKMNGLAREDISGMTDLIQGVVYLTCQQLLKNDPELTRVEAYQLAQNHVGMAIHWLHVFNQTGEISLEGLSNLVVPESQKPN